MENKYHMGIKHCEKRRNCLLQAISPFLTMFSTDVYLLVRQNAVLCGNGLKDYLICCLHKLPIPMHLKLCHDVDLTFSQTTNFRLFQTGMFCR